LAGIKGLGRLAGFEKQEQAGQTIRYRRLRFPVGIAVKSLRQLQQDHNNNWLQKDKFLESGTSVPEKISDDIERNWRGAVPDTGAACLVLLLRFFGMPGDAAQLRHEFAASGQAMDADALVRGGRVAFPSGRASSNPRGDASKSCNCRP
jgi:hypothetical protein